MKYIVQCPLCGEQELDFDSRRAEFLCEDCGTFDVEEIHIKAITKKDMEEK